VVDGEILSVPIINTPIEGGTAVITGKFTTEQAMVLANALNAPLPFKVSVVESKIF
jgi:preprotein translocase subunit SecD